MNIQVESVRLRHVAVPLVEPFRISNGEIREKEAIIVEVEQNGLRGFGEASPMSGSFYSSETPETTWEFLQSTLIPFVLHNAFSSAEEFVEKYKAAGDQQIIGHFGLGFYSSFMVAQQVDIDTLSYKPDAQPVHWSCDGSSEFELSDSTRSDRGTTVTLTLQEEEQEYLEPYRIRQLIKTYCDFLPVPIKLEVKEAIPEAAPATEPGCPG